MIGIGLVLLTACIFLCIFIYRQRALLRDSKKALHAINAQSLDDNAYLNAIAALIRRHAISKNKQCSGLQGEQWQQHLLRYMPEDIAMLLAISRYKNTSDIDRQALHAAALLYIKGKAK
jgi:hypothetical protein